MMQALRDRPLVLPALLLWGWQVDLFAIAAVMGVLLEAPRLVRFRIEIAQGDFERLWSFTAVLFLAVIFYLLLADRGLGGAESLFGTGAAPAEARPAGQRASTTALTFLRWVPPILLPFVLAHAWSRTTTLPWRTFSLYEQNRAKREPLARAPSWAARPMQPGLAFALAVLFAAAVTPDPGPWFLPVWTVVLLSLLWPWRNPRYGIAVLAPLVLVLLTGAWAAQGAHQLTQLGRELLEQRFQDGGGGTAGSRSTGELIRTSFGTVGRLQMSDAILLRGEHPPGRPPGLLGEAVFDRFTGKAWESTRRTYQPLAVTVAPLDADLLTITRPAAGGAAPVVLPLDLRDVCLPVALRLEANAIGTVRAVDAAFLLVHQVRPGGPAMAPPGVEDLRLDRVPVQDREAVAAVLAEIGIEPAATLPARIVAWLGSTCAYSLDQEPLAPGTTPLAQFLSVRRLGHCEYFASAAAMLLRAGGIPTRYVVGYSPEAQGDGTWIARGRHAHAWCLAWQQDRWIEIDATPGGWLGASADRASWWRPLADVWAWIGYQFDRWRTLGGNWRAVVFVVGALILAWIALRQLRGSQWLRLTSRSSAAVVPGADSELLAYVARCERAGRPRAAGQSLKTWGADLGPAWSEALALHERLRFDPAGLTTAERERLRALAAGLAIRTER